MSTTIRTGWQRHRQAAIGAAVVIVAAGRRGVLHGFYRANVLNGVILRAAGGLAATELAAIDAGEVDGWSGALDVEFTDGLELQTTTADEMFVYFRDDGPI